MTASPFCGRSTDSIAALGGGVPQCSGGGSGCAFLLVPDIAVWLPSGELT